MTTDLPEYADLPSTDAEIAEHFGPHALTRLNLYACFLEDIIIARKNVRDRSKARKYHEYLDEYFRQAPLHQQLELALA